MAQVGTPREIYESPLTPWVASFVGDTVEVEGTWEDRALECETCGAKEFCEGAAAAVWLQLDTSERFLGSLAASAQGLYSR